MALHFSETAPGVHTTTLTNPKTEKRHNIAIIESCNAWQLFIDGALAARDLPSFKAAIAEAESKVTSRRTSMMVRAACVLVLLSVAGASAVGMTKVLSPMFGEDAIVAAIASDTKTPEIAPRFNRVRPSAAKFGNRKPEPVAPKSIEQNVKPKLQAPIEQVVVTVLEAPKGSTKPKPPARNVVDTPPKTKPAETAAAPETPAATALGLKPIVAPRAEAPAAAPTRITANVEPAAPVVIDTKPAPALAAASKPSASPIGTDETFASNQASPSGELPELLPAASEREADSEAIAPPLPAKAPVYSAPLVRSARTPISAERLNSILADIEEEAEEPITRSTVAAAPRPTKIKRRTRSKRAAKRKVRRVRRTTSRRKVRRSRPAYRQHTAHSARAYRLPPPRMVCFGHTCRFR